MRAASGTRRSIWLIAQPPSMAIAAKTTAVAPTMDHSTYLFTLPLCRHRPIRESPGRFHGNRLVIQSIARSMPHRPIAAPRHDHADPIRIERPFSATA